ncbi:hypothetical protein T4D_12781 [Trichinella pseudospiralis]|uniref:Uncharacterized protein n=1 Tax=Trichinella pseudospiralis TaxID=6337 RepID=A0A0V1G2I1_TRIPS|nr:hypothetical protein T4D_12781 [Trichinella pseudospiralis]
MDRNALKTLIKQCILEENNKLVKLRKLKNACEENDTAVQVHNLLMQMVRSARKSSRLNLLNAIDFLFRECCKFRSEMLSHLREFVFRTVPLKGRQDYLPRVVDDDQQKFSCRVLEVLKKWIGEFGSSNVELQLLKDFLSFNVHNLLQNNGSSSFPNSNSHCSFMPNLRVMKKMCSEFEEVEPEIASTLNELENSLHSLFPLVECCTSGTVSVKPSCSTDDHLLIPSANDTPVRIKISLDRPSLQRTAENSNTIKRARESYLRICREFLPSMGRWNRFLSRSRHSAVILRENSFSSFESIRHRLSSLLERIQLAKRKFEDIHFDEDIMIDSDESDFEEVI